VSVEQDAYDAALARLREALEARAFAAAWDDGRRLSIDDAAKLALSSL
jgi:hypothetical protein